MREHLEQGEYDVDEIMCQQYLFIGIIAGCIGNIRWLVAPVGMETSASSYS